MHKITATILAAWAAFHAAASRLSLSVRSVLLDLHIANLKAMVLRADTRVARLLRLRNYHEAQAASVADLVGLASGAANAAASMAKEEAAKHGVTLEV